MRWNTSTRSTRKRSTLRSISHNMLLVPSMEARWVDYILDMVVVMGEARMDIIITIMAIILDMDRDRGVGAVGLIRMVAIKGT